MTARPLNHLTVALFTLTLFLSAALMFSIQPMVGKMLLPVVGGTPAGWIVAMAFFQIALLAGYGLAYGLARLKPLVHGVLFLAGLLLGMFLLPVSITAREGADIHAFGTFILLALTVGLPFTILSATSTTVQRLFGATGHPAAGDPYFLYAASNLGSFAGLLLYPLLIEPNWTLGAQASNWMYGYAALMALIGLDLAFVRKEQAQGHAAAAHAPIPWARKGRWLAYSFIPASLLMGYTSYITRDIYSAPLVWVLPLGLYLLTFVVAFSKQKRLTSQNMAFVQLLATMAGLLLVTVLAQYFRNSLAILLAHLACMTVLILAFHIRLVEDRPLGSGRHLAEFYFFMSLGGALAGCFNAFIAPLVFNQSLELPLVLLAGLLFHPRLQARMASWQIIGVIVASILFVVYVATWTFAPLTFTRIWPMAALAVFFAAGNARTLLFFGALVFTTTLLTDQGDVIARSRNFFGNIVIYDKPLYDAASDKVYDVRYIKHGTTVHGFQVLDDTLRHEPVSYYGPLRSLFDVYNPEKVLAMGLGAGMINCYAGPGREMTFIEIDPAVISAAREHFTYLSGCGGSAPRIITGDGRLELEKLGQEKFDLIIVDVFSSDYIPAHLMTTEAIRLYRDRLSDEGILVFHISNIFFNLAPPLTASADQLGMEARIHYDTETAHSYENISVWVAMSPGAGRLSVLEPFDWFNIRRREGARPWTDDYSDFLSVLIALQPR